MQATPVVSLTSSALTAPWGTSVTFTAKLTGGGAPPSGIVAFRDGGSQLGIGTLNSSGIAEFSTNALDVGTYSITAAYGGDSNYLPATSSALAMVVNKAEPTITWSNPAAVSYGTALSAKQLNATASVPGTFVYSPVAGTVLGTGSQTLSVTFTPAGSADYRTATATILVNPAMLTVTASNYSRVLETANPTFNYTITGFVNGDTQSAVSGSPVLSTSATISSAVGSYPITAGLGTLTASHYTFGLVAGTLSITQATAPISLSANPTAPTSTTVALGANVTLTATVSPTSGSAPAPTGTVTFSDGTTVLGAASVSASGVASFITNSLAAGSNTITAVYGGDKNYRASTSSATLTISDFQLRAMPDSVVLTPTQQATVRVTVTPESGFNQTLTFTCSTLPADTSCSFAPPAITPNGASASVVILTISAAQTAGLDQRRSGPPSLIFAALQISCCLGLFVLIFDFRRGRKTSLMTNKLLTAGGVSLLLIFVCSCGGTRYGFAPGAITYVTVTATSGTLSHTATVKLRVK
jgi:Bacterial Ig-like domain (group 3)/MBG domain (YGX type)